MPTKMRGRERECGERRKESERGKLSEKKRNE